MSRIDGPENAAVPLAALKCETGDGSNGSDHS
jgi:hypothetical protein